MVCGRPGKAPPSSWIVCYVCRGEGKVTQQQLLNYRMGERWRKARIAADQTIGDRAKQLGMSIVEVSELERGSWRCRRPGCSTQFPHTHHATTNEVEVITP